MVKYLENNAFHKTHGQDFALQSSGKSGLKFHFVGVKMGHVMIDHLQ